MSISWLFPMRYEEWKHAIPGDNIFLSPFRLSITSNHNKRLKPGGNKLGFSEILHKSSYVPTRLYQKTDVTYSSVVRQKASIFANGKFHLFDEFKINIFTAWEAVKCIPGCLQSDVFKRAVMCTGPFFTTRRSFTKPSFRIKPGTWSYITIKAMKNMTFEKISLSP